MPSTAASQQITRVKTPVHIAIRAALFVRVEGRRLNIIETHNQVIAKLGNVAFAKFGQPGTQERAEKITKQIHNGHQTFLIVVIKRNGEFHGFQSPIAAVHLGGPTQQLKKLTPEYYEKIHENPSLWFLLNGPLTTSKLGDFCLLSNGRPLLDVVKESRTTSMLVTERPKT